MNTSPRPVSQPITTATPSTGLASMTITQALPPTPAQHEIWLSDQFGPDASRAFNEGFLITIDGIISQQTVQQVLNLLAQRHDSLRARFSRSGERMIILEHEAFFAPITDLRDPSETSATLESICHDLVTRAFDLTMDSLWRTHIVYGEETTTVAIMLHHIIADGWSHGVLMNDFGWFYRHQLGIAQPPLPPSKPFAEYIVHSTRHQQSDAATLALEYWKTQFSDKPDALDLPTDSSRGANRTFHGSRLDVPLSPELCDRIQAAATAQRCTRFSWLFSCYIAYLHKLTQRSDIITGIPAAGQSVADLPDLVGHCVNMLPIRYQIKNDETLSSLMRSVREKLLNAYEHQEFTFSQLIGELNLPYDRSRIPLVSNTFNMDREMPTVSLGEFRGTYSSIPREYENFEWFFNFACSENGLILECSYNSDLFGADTIQHRVDQFLHVVSLACEEPDLSLTAVSLFSALDQALLQEVNATHRRHTAHEGFVNLFEKIAFDHGDKKAVVFGGKALTYRKLNEQANQLANFLLTKGLSPGDIVGICLPRSIQMLTAVIAIQKAGATWLPLDPEHPPSRLHYMMGHAGVRLLITHSTLNVDVPDQRTRVLELDQKASSIATQRTRNPVKRYDPNQICYVIYTSGSTGNPKGVQISNHNLQNFLHGMQHRPGITADDNMLAVTTLSFDISILELLLPLTVGASVTVCSRATLLDGAALADLLNNENITMMQATPGVWRLLIEAGWQGKSNLKALTGGENLPGDLVAPLSTRTAELWNMYGPTETTIWSTCQKITNSNAPVRIGTPIDNTTVHLLNKQNQPVAVGATGELCIGGDGLSPGYLHQQELTNEQFVEIDGQRLYRTGDLCRLHADGTLEYCTRIDTQIKLRGYRIETAEIESVLSRHPDIIQAVVVLSSITASDRRLVAWYTTRHGRSISLSELKQHVKQHLPDYMLPQHFERLESIPETPNGKVDRKALPATPSSIEGQDSISKAHPPETETEKTVAKLWSKLMGIDTPGRNDNFFDLGGHSLLAVSFIRAVRETYSVTLPLRLLLSESLEQIALHLNPDDRPSVLIAEELTPKKPANRVDARFIRVGNQSLFTYVHCPVEQQSKHAVVLCHSVGHEYMRSHRAMRQLATRLADRGFFVLRFDYSGTGDSSGVDNDTTISTWVKEIKTAISHLRMVSGCSTISAAGIRFGGTLLSQVSHEFDRVVLWDPIISGEEYLTTLSGMHDQMLADLDRFRRARKRRKTEPSQEMLGFHYSEKWQSEARRIHLQKRVIANARHFHCVWTRNSLPTTEDVNYGKITEPSCTQHYTGDECHWHNAEQIDNAILPHATQQKVVELLTVNYQDA